MPIVIIRKNRLLKMEYKIESLNCDASFRTKPTKVMEWQVKDTLTGEVLYTNKIEGGTSNIAEFLAIVDAMIFMEQEGINLPVYSDSKVAIRWVKQKVCSTWAEDLTEELKNLISDYEQWLENFSHNYEILKWQTWSWGEIPSDFNRK